MAGDESQRDEAAAVHQVLESWQIEPRGYRQRGSVMRVDAVEGAFCLKPVRKSQGRIDFMFAVMEHVRERGFSRLQPLLPTASGAVAVWRKGVAWTLTRWVEGRELSYDRPAEVRSAAGVLAAFHLAAAGFSSRSLSRWQSNLGKWPSKVASRCSELLAASRLAANARPEGVSAFTLQLASQAEILATHARRALTILGSPAYQQLCQAQGNFVPVCHGDPAAHNFIVATDGTVQLIDLNSLRVDLPCVDLWKLIRRIAFHLDWAPDALSEVMKAYCAVRPAGKAEMEVLLGLLWFPEKQWRLVVDATKARPGWTADRAQAPLPGWLEDEMSQAGHQLPAKERYLEVLGSNLR